jgi:hypothetical protein
VSTPLGFIGYTLLQSFVICAVLVSLCDICKRVFRFDDLLTFCAAVLALGVAGYACFWIAYADYAVFGVVKIALLVVLLAYLGYTAWRYGLRAYAWLTEPLLYTFLFVVIVLTLGFSNGGFDNPAAVAANRFSHELPIDNIIPLIVADALKKGFIASPLFGDWLSSDRPPLQTGLYFLLTLQNGKLGYQVVASWLQATFLFGAWGLAVSAAIPAAARRVILLACCLLPTAIINTLYTWPKMLAVGYLLLVFALLFCQRPETGAERKMSGILIGGLTALAILSHGSSLFALIGFTVVVVIFWAWPPLKTMICGAATLLALYVPWMLYQILIDPPGDRLLKWHFAGVIDIDSRPFLATLRESYGALSWHDYLQGRLTNLTPLIGAWPGNLFDPLIGPLYGSWAPEGIRATDFFYFLPSLHLFSLAVIAAVLLLAFVQSPQRGIALRLFVALVGTLAAFVILIFIPGQTINHQGTYAAQALASVFAFMVLSLRAPWLALLFIAAQSVTIATVYAFTLNHNPRLWPLEAICVAATFALFSYSLYPCLARTAYLRADPKRVQ